METNFTSSKFEEPERYIFPENWNSQNQENTSWFSYFENINTTNAGTCEYVENLNPFLKEHEKDANASKDQFRMKSSSYEVFENQVHFPVDLQQYRMTSDVYQQDSNSSDASPTDAEEDSGPFSLRSRIPVPHSPSGYHTWLEESFMHRRNERERQRVRNVNDGFSRLRNHLPRELRMRRRQSKVETLRHAIDYIKQLQRLLQEKKCEKLQK